MQAVSKRVVIIGGGAAGFFAAINIAEKNPGYSVTILEKSSTVLSKVKISGGGRCNVTHACFEPRELVKFYPRGEKQLLGPFTKFNPSNTIDWFRKRGVEIKREADGRMFPVTDSSQTIIDCFWNEARRLGVQVKMQCGVEKLQYTDSKFQLKTSTGNMEADVVVVTAGSSHSVWKILEELGHIIVPPVASLFTFNIKDERINGLEGLSVENALVSVVSNSQSKIRNPQLSSSGPLLITHWGMSGPAILRLSAWGARQLAETKYQFDLEVNWVNKDLNEVRDHIKSFKQNSPKKSVATTPLFNIPKRLWERLVIAQGVNQNFADLSNVKIDNLTKEITQGRYMVNGKSTFKDEFVTAGGVDLADIDFRTLQSKKVPNLYFAGEVLDIDAITGGFNFQAAWTTAFIVSQTI
jgi:predicted Rossmann fold flavoprotein